MANFSVNQVRHLYVADGYTSGSTTQGLISKVVKTPENELYFLYNGADGVLKSDFIPLNTITYAKAIDAADNGTPMRKVKITLDANINSGAPVTGQDYVLGINFKNFFSSGDASQYYKDAAVHVTSSIDNAKKLFDALKDALNLAFSREDGATATSNPYLSFTTGGSGSGGYLLIEEKEQPWVLGTMPQRRVLFDLFIGTIYTGGDDVIWGVQADQASSTTVGNGKKVADLEWFCCGERGDQYRYMGYPNVIPTKYFVDPTKEYHLIEIHYAFTDTGVNSYRTEKEVTIAVPKGASTANYTAVNAVITAINTAAGSTLITTLS